MRFSVKSLNSARLESFFLAEFFNEHIPLLFAFFSCIADPPAERKTFEFAHADTFFSLSFLFWPEFLAAKNLAWLNNSNYDEIVYARHFLDVAAFIVMGKRRFRLISFKPSVLLEVEHYGALLAGVLKPAERPSNELKTIFGAIGMHSIWQTFGYENYGSTFSV